MDVGKREDQLLDKISDLIHEREDLRAIILIMEATAHAAIDA